MSILGRKFAQAAIYGSAGGGGGTPFGITQAATQTTTTGTIGVNTFAGVAIGAADGTRIVVVTVCHGITSGTTLSAFTIGGITATQGAVSVFSGGSTAEIWYAAVPTGTTATIQFTQSAADSRIVLGVYRVVGTGVSFSTGNAANGVTNTSISASVTIPAGGGAIAAVMTHSSTSGSGTPTNMTLDTNNLVVGNSTSYIGNNTSGSGSTSIGVSWTGATDVAMAVVAFTP